MSGFPLIRILDFVAGVFPFETLDREELKRVVGRMELAYYPTGEDIIRSGEEPAENLYIIHHGSVKVTVTSESGQKSLIDIRGEGDMFGAVSIIHGIKALFTVTANEDLLTFLLPAAEFKHLVECHRIFQNHFQLSLAGNIRAYYDSSPSHPGLIIGVDSVREMASQMRGRVAELMSPNVLTCAPGVPVRQAAVEMTSRGVGSIVVMNGSENPLGILTDTDLRARVLARGRSPDIPVSDVMSRPPVTISHQAFAFEAMLEMTRFGVHHLLVTHGDRMLGVISDHDIKVITGSTPVGLAREIEKVSSMEELARFPNRINRVLKSLMNLGSSAEYMMDLIGEFMDRIYIKLFELCERRMHDTGLGRAPAGFTWLALGRAGRREMAPPLRHEHALIYTDVPPGQDGIVREWFIGFCRRLNDALIEWRFPSDPFEVVIAAPESCRNVSDWRREYMNWVRHPMTMRPGDPGMAFDFRALHGEASFESSLRASLWEAIDAHPEFLVHLARREMDQKPPLGFLRESVVDREGAYLDHLDLEWQGLRPLAGALRVLALEQKIEKTNTLARLQEVAEKIGMNKQLKDDLHEAFNLITVLWISQYLETAESTKMAGDFSVINPAHLNMMQRKMLKESFGVIMELQDLLKKRYHLENDS